MTEIQDIKDEILEVLLPDVVFDGWTWQGVQDSAVRAGYDRSMANAVFPGGMDDVIGHFSDWSDRKMLDHLKSVKIEELRVRDRIRQAVLARLDILSPHKDAVKHAAAYWAMPLRGIKAGKVMWRTADRIWVWAGDTATDYNHYTKRGLLCAVLSATILAWANDEAQENEGITDFLDRRIENVMQLGKTVGKFKRAS